MKRKSTGQVLSLIGLMVSVSAQAATVTWMSKTTCTFKCSNGIIGDAQEPSGPKCQSAAASFCGGMALVSSYSGGPGVAPSAGPVRALGKKTCACNGIQVECGTPCNHFDPSSPQGH